MAKNRSFEAVFALIIGFSLIMYAIMLAFGNESGIILGSAYILTAITFLNICGDWQDLSPLTAVVVVLLPAVLLIVGLIGVVVLFGIFGYEQIFHRRG